MEWAKAFSPTFTNLGLSITCAERKDEQVRDKIESVYFVGYPKCTYGWYSYDPRDQKVFVRTTSIFFEDDYIMNYKPRERIVLEEVSGKPSESPTINENME